MNTKQVSRDKEESMERDAKLYSLLEEKGYEVFSVKARFFAQWIEIHGPMPIPSTKWNSSVNTALVEIASEIETLGYDVVEVYWSCGLYNLQLQREIE